MKYRWLAQKKEDCLLIFCNGWGMDERPFAQLETAGIDVLILSDFRNLSTGDGDAVLAITDEAHRYGERILLAWSMGVWAAHVLFAERKNSFQRTIALNGTLCPINERYGISRELFRATGDNWSEVSRQKFYRRMCGERILAERFLKHAPCRSVAEQCAELNWYLDEVDCRTSDDNFFDEKWVSEKDRIMPTENQLRFWGSGIHFLEGGHFPFYQRSGWRELLLLGDTPARQDRN